MYCRIIHKLLTKKTNTYVYNHQVFIVTMFSIFYANTEDFILRHKLRT